MEATSGCSSFVKIFALVATVLAASSVPTVKAQHTSFGKCPNFNVILNFNQQRYLGRWYEYSKYETSFQKDAKCCTADYSDESIGELVQIGVVNRSIKKGAVTYSNATGEAVLGEPENPTKPGKLIVNFDSQPSFTRATRTNYNIVYTDYDSFAVVYACSSRFFFFKREFLWILTREKIPSPNLIDLAYMKIQEAQIDISRLIKTVQEDCPTSR